MIVLSGCGSSGNSTGDNNAENINTHSTLVLSYISSYNTSGQARGTLKEGNIIYVADGGSGLLILQISSDGSLNPMGSYPMLNGGHARSLAKVGNYLFMACRSEGLIVINISDPTNPILVYSYDTTDMATFITIDGSILYLTSQNSLQIFDISIPHTPVLLDDLVVQGEFEHIVVHNGLAYIAGYYKGLFVVDVSDPTAVKILKTVGRAPGVGPLWAISKQGNYLFAGAESSGLLVYDIQDKLNPYLIATLALPDEAEPKPWDQPPFHMQAHGSYLFVADGYSGIQVVDISDPALPFIAAEALIPDARALGAYTWDFFIDGYTMVVGDYLYGIRMFNVGSWPG